MPLGYLYVFKIYEFGYLWLLEDNNWLLKGFKPILSFLLPNYFDMLGKEIKELVLLVDL